MTILKTYATLEKELEGLKVTLNVTVEKEDNLPPYVRVIGTANQKNVELRSSMGSKDGRDLIRGKSKEDIAAHIASVVDEVCGKVMDELAHQVKVDAALESL